MVRGAPPMRPHTIRTTDALWEQVNEACLHNQEDISAVVRRGLEAYVERTRRNREKAALTSRTV